MPRARHEILIHASPEQVWRSFAEESNPDDEARGIRVEMHPPGPLITGTVIRRIGKVGGVERVTEAMCTGANRPHTYTVQWDEKFQGSVPLRFTVTMAFKAIGETTRVTWTTRAEAPNPVAWFVAWLLMGPMKLVQRNEMAKAKSRLELKNAGNDPSTPSSRSA
jgi:carbon monoxide dehydrogenase subunit G